MPGSRRSLTPTGETAFDTRAAAASSTSLMTTWPFLRDKETRSDNHLMGPKPQCGKRKWIGRGYFIMQQIRKIHNLSLHPAEMPPDWASPCEKHHAERKKLLSEACSSQRAKLICKCMQEIKKQNYTGKWGSYTWIVRIMNNYCEFPAPNITCFLINKDLIIEMRWRISAALINLAEKTSPRWPAVMKRACPESAERSQAPGCQGSGNETTVALSLTRTQECHNFFL